MILNNSTNLVTHDNSFTLTNSGAVKNNFTINGVVLPSLFKQGQFIYSNSEFELTEYGIEKIQKYLIKEVDKISSKIEFGNIDLNGSTIDTSEKAQARINGAYSAVLIDPARIIDFKNSDGSWVQINATVMTEIANAVAAHVQSCFTNEKVLNELIKSKSSYDDLMDIDLNVGWANVVNDPFNIDRFRLGV